MIEALIAGGALIIVALVGLVGTVMRDGGKTRKLNSIEHADNAARGAMILDHVVHLHEKIDHVGTIVEHNAEKVDVAIGELAVVAVKVDTVAGALHVHLTEMGAEQRQEAGFMEERLSKVPAVAIVPPILNEGA